jgi:O-antigen/teichoic acid export membrane protein
LIRLGKSVFYNFFGSLFDKGLPIIISAFLTKFMLVEEYGKWSLFFQFILIINAVCATPIMTIFARNFYSRSEDQQKMFIYNYKHVFLMFILSSILYYTFFGIFSLDMFFEIPALLCISFYTYLGLFFRFKSQNKKYFVYSFVRLFVFGMIVFGLLLINKKISYFQLTLIFILSHIPSLVKTFSLIDISSNENKSDLKDFYSLSLYGLSTTLVNGLDKFAILASGFSLSFLAYYSFIYTLTNSPTIIVEAMKKSIQPKMYKELAEKNTISRKTLIQILTALSFILVIQVIVPCIMFYLLGVLNLIHEDFMAIKNSYYFISILSLGFFFQAIYHFINPVHFYYKKSMLLFYVQMSCMIIYVIILYFFSSWFDFEKFMWLKSLILILVTLVCFVSLKKIKFINLKMI